MTIAVAEADHLSKFLDLDVSAWHWGALGIAVLVLLGIDLYRHRDDHAPTFGEAAKESAFWVACGLAFAVFMWWQWDGQASGEYLAVYLTEKSLSIDNVFVWALLFSTMKIPLKYQHRVLFWGIFGALVFRAIFIFVGSALVQRFAWVLVIFGVFLIITGARIIRHTEDEEDDAASTAGLGLLRRLMPVTDSYDGHNFFTKIDGKRVATPLLAALFVVETTDIIFAVDSVPASFGVANDPYTILAANAFAIMGLRAMYFLLADARERFHYLAHALGGILIFVGIKLSITPWYHIDIFISLGIIISMMVLAVVFSIWRNRQLGISWTDDPHNHSHGQSRDQSHSG